MADTETFEKTFLVQGEAHTDPEHPAHDDNAVGTVQEALREGWHAKGDVSLKRAEVVDHDRRGRAAVELTYSVPAVLAEDDSADDNALTTVDPADAVYAGRGSKTSKAKAKAEDEK